MSTEVLPTFGPPSGYEPDYNNPSPQHAVILTLSAAKGKILCCSSRFEIRFTSE